ncbi:unnamed protein product [Prorocentrum cordatum]|uniref:AAA+ ATPase domain-containing protein n=1 Tax=Prorocentrum cordatum TaxID=2364126 RepID=A0ABN9U934_9DINO|nr:unnamed protein product [Polarella glacialis]
MQPPQSQAREARRGTLAAKVAAPLAAVLAALLLLRRAARRGAVPLVGALGAALRSFRAAVSVLPEEIRGPLMGTVYLSVPVSIMGALGGVSWKVYGIVQTRLAHVVEKHCKVSLSFSNKDKHYDSVVDYIGSRCSVTTGKLLASTQPRSQLSFQELLAGWLGGKTKSPTLYYQPDIQSFSNNFFWTDEEGITHKFWLERHIDKPQLRTGESSKQRDPEVIVLTLWWTTDPKPLKEFLAAALKTMLRDDSEGKVEILVKHQWFPMWSKAVSKEKRDRDSIVLDEKLADSVVEDMKHFFTKKTADWYHSAGIPYRRGYLLYGPPGCGKTTFAQVLAGELGLDVCLMNLSNKDMNDDDLAELLRAAPPRSMLLLEDVDAIFVERAANSTKKEQGGGISFSGLLNALDGAAAQEGCVIVMTTNHKDRLDEALIRPGRCDVHVHISEEGVAGPGEADVLPVLLEGRGREVRGWRRDGDHRRPPRLRYGGRRQVQTRRGRPPGGTGEPVPGGRRHPVRPGGERKAARAVCHRGAGPQRGRGRSAAARGRQGHQAAGRPGGGGSLQLEEIPEGQVSMAKLQGYLMKQKLAAEQHFKALRDSDALSGPLAQLDPASEDFKQLWVDEVNRFASEAAVLNVHELLDVTAEAEEVRTSIHDHFRRVGVHRFAPIFEHFGIREKRDLHLHPNLKDRMGSWHPDLKCGPLRDRLVALLDGTEAVNRPYNLADLSSLRDRFIEAFQDSAQPGDARQEALPRGSVSPRDAALSGAAPPRLKLLRSSSGLREEEQLNLLDMAHKFQEALEDRGKTEVSLWQLEVHFRRYAQDPAGALENCRRLLRPSRSRSATERQPRWMTTFGFLRRLGLESHAFDLEDAGFNMWQDWKHLSVDDLKGKAGMSDREATLCHAVLQANTERPDLLHMFQLGEFADIEDAFAKRFPEASAQQAREFAAALSDELGVSEFSRHQIHQSSRPPRGRRRRCRGWRRRCRRWRPRPPRGSGPRRRRRRSRRSGCTAGSRRRASPTSATASAARRSARARRCWRRPSTTSC